LSQNGFSQAEQYSQPTFKCKPQFGQSRMTKSQGFNSPDGCEFNESVSISLETLVVKELPCMFSPRKSLEQVVGELKGKYSPVLTNESN
jgi:hypothetical protein